MLTTKLLITIHTFTYYIDSINGSDSNNGRSVSTAFATIDALPTITAGMRIGLAKGSHWREQLTIGVDNVTVAAYGTGNRPILDASNVIDSWTKTAGQTNVYQASVNADIASAKTWVNAWEDDTFLARASSIADCDATPGSYYPSADTGTGPVTLYVHTTNSDDPATNGSVYEASVRRYCLTAILRSGCTLRGITTRRNLHEDGSCIPGRSATVVDCRFEDGSKHNALVNDGSTLTDCVAEGAYYNGGGSSLFVLYQVDPSGLGSSWTRCQALNTGGAVGVTGYLSHTSGSGSLGTVTFTDCVTDGCSDGYTILGGATALVLDGSDVLNFSGVGLLASTPSVTVQNGSRFKTAASSGYRRAIQVNGSNQVVTIDSSYICVPTSSGGAIWTSSNLSLVLNNSVFSSESGVLVYQPAAQTGLDLQCYGNIFDIVALTYELNGTFTLDSNENEFSRGWVRLGAAEYTTLAEYQSATGQDADSVLVAVGAGEPACQNY